jgi:hypothetical protein
VAEPHQRQVEEEMTPIHELRLTQGFRTQTQARLWASRMRKHYASKGIILKVERSERPAGYWYVWRTTTPRDYTELSCVDKTGGGLGKMMSVVEYSLLETFVNEPIVRIAAKKAEQAEAVEVINE